MDTREAMLAAIRKEPEDDTLRLAYADFVEENGGPLLAAAIRAHIELYNCGKKDRGAVRSKFKAAVVGYTKKKLGEYFSRFAATVEYTCWSPTATFASDPSAYRVSCYGVSRETRESNFMAFVWVRGLIVRGINNRHRFFLDFCDELSGWHPLDLKA